MEEKNQVICTEFGLLLANIKNKMRNKMNESLKPYGLTAEQRAILLILSEKKSLTQVELCNLTSMVASNLSTTLKRIENKNYIKKIPHPTDLRAYLVELTEQSIEIINIIKDLGNQIRNEMLNNIDLEELKTTCKVLNLININLKN
jgi:DNA-binding MarR family transcriptional regulator